MKELNLNNLIQEKTHLEIKKKQEVESKITYTATIIPHGNHRLYEIDTQTGEISMPEYLKSDYIFNHSWKKGDRIVSNHQVVIQQGKAYVSALNKENATKKFENGSSGTKIDPTKVYLDL